MAPKKEISSDALPKSRTSCADGGGKWWRCIGDDTPQNHRGYHRNANTIPMLIVM